MLAEAPPTNEEGTPSCPLSYECVICMQKLLVTEHNENKDEAQTT